MTESMSDDDLRRQIVAAAAKEETMMPNTGTAKENIYTEQISQLINAVDEIGSHVATIENKVSVISESSVQETANIGSTQSTQAPAGLPDIPPESSTLLSSRLAELASHIARLNEHVIKVRDKIIV